MDSHSKSSNYSHSVTHGFSHTHTDYMTGITKHACTSQCAPLHLSARLQALEQHLQRLSMTLPVRDFLWYRDAIAAIFATIWEGKHHAQD